MAAKKAKPGFEFIIASLNKNKKASYKDIAAAAAAKKLKVFPVMFGRAQAMLGIIKQAKRGKGKRARVKADVVRVKVVIPRPAVVVGKRGPGRPRKNANAVLDSTLKSIIAIVKSGELEKARYHKALERIQRLVADALA